MEKIRDMKCWEIMQCPEDKDCVAKEQSNASCWDLATSHNHLQSELEVCSDCIVYIAKKNPPQFTETELLEILGHPKRKAYNYHKCPTFMIKKAQDLRSERREAERYRLKGYTRAVIAHKDKFAKFAYSILDMSSKGLAFCYSGRGEWDTQPLHMDIRVNDFSLKGLPVSVISDTPIDSDFEESRRCSVRFTDLSLGQESMVKNLIQHHCLGAAF